ncbi:MAG: ABC transporter permease [Lachnospiraceae bacterium]|nr:ABC transporter permease [Lachnospiraceae bacterium]
MSRTQLFHNLIRANIKRLFRYIPSLLIAMFFMLALIMSAGSYLSKKIYKSENYETAKIAYFLDRDGDERYINLAIDYLSTMKSMRETANIIEVESVDEGYRLLNEKEVLFFIYLPAGFYNGIMTGHNPTINLVVRDTTTIAAYISNELFLSLAKYLAVAQAGIYSALDTAWAHEMSDDDVLKINNLSNKIFFKKVLDKDAVINVVEATSEGSYSLKKHYEAVAIMLSLLFMAFILIPYIQNYCDGTSRKLSIMKISKLHIFASNFLCVFISVYIAYIPCYLVVSILNKHFNSNGLITAFLSVLIIAIIISIIGSLSKSVFSGNLIILFTAIAIAYIGGGILPHAMLPRVIQNISAYMPGQYIISNLAHSLFG